MGGGQENSFAISWTCPRCRANLSLVIYPTGPLVPVKGGCLNCGHPQPATDGAACSSCGIAPGDLATVLAEDAGKDPVAQADNAFGRSLYHRGLLLLNRAIANDVGCEDAWQRKCAFLRALGYRKTLLEMLEQALRAGAPVSLLADLGCALDDAGKHAEAEAAYRVYLAKAPQGSRVATVTGNLANSLRALGRTQEAEELYRKAIELDSKESSPYLNYSRQLGSLGRLAEAVQVLDAGLQAVPPGDRRDILLMERAMDEGARVGGKERAALIRQSGDAQARVAMFRCAVEQEPDRASHYLACVHELEGQGRTGEALTCVQAGLDKCKTDEYVVYLLEEKAWLLAEARDASGALAAADAALAMSADRARASYLRGRALCSLGRLAEGRSMMEKVLALNPGHQDAKRALRMIDDALRDGAGKK